MNPPLEKILIKRLLLIRHFWAAITFFPVFIDIFNIAIGIAMIVTYNSATNNGDSVFAIQFATTK